MADKIYIKEFIPIESAQDVIDCLYRDANGERQPYANPTYLDPECTQLECGAQRRSFDDLFILAKTYYPKTTQKALMLALKNLKLKYYFCGQIRKLVFHYTTWGGAKTLAKNNFEKIGKKYIYAEGTFTAAKLEKIYNRI